MITDRAKFCNEASAGPSLHQISTPLCVGAAGSERVCFDDVRDDQLSTAKYINDAYAESVGALSVPSQGIGQHTHSDITKMSSSKCQPLCRCRCHARSHGKTPRWLKEVVGELMFDFTAVLYSGPCSILTCRQSPRKSTFTYRFPSWMVSRFLIASSTFGSLTGTGATWSLRMPLVIRDDWRWNTIQEGNLSMIKRLIERQELSPYMVDIYGRGAILVSRLHITSAVVFHS